MMKSATQSCLNILKTLPYTTGQSIIHFTDHNNHQKTWLGLTPTATHDLTTFSDIQHLETNLAHTQPNTPCVWTLATSYEWGLTQLKNTQTPSHIVALQYHHGYWLNHTLNTIEPFGTPELIPSKPTPINTPTATISPLWSQSDFANAIHTAQHAIKEGDIYQVNLSYPCTITSNASLSDIYRYLLQQNIPNHAAFIKTDHTTIASCSPEEFIYIHNNTIRTRPIKGTIGRHANPTLDQTAYNTLKHSEKDKAELIMITDLLRNDLGQCCDIGSVTVNELCAIKAYDYVYHLVSTITGTLQTQNPLQTLATLSPGGSISGCPKHAACNIIQTLEPYPRQFYTGNMGFIASTGEAAFNIAIRTCYQTTNAPIFTHTGCGITTDSNPKDEYQESLDKLRFLTDYIKHVD